MPDREKTIEALSKALARVGYGDMDNVTLTEVEKAIESAIDLLVEQEPVKPISAHVWARTYGRCGNCEAPLPALEGLRSKFCWMCGKAVKWDG